ncbi:hypothetical protein N0B44_28730 [Roseibacterium beibuensis]|nr:hypothetical protein [Roseibacterium beibuensis]MCS6626909.1 hypothetical protein [Roseibacterium beibuensis]
MPVLALAAFGLKARSADLRAHLWTWRFVLVAAIVNLILSVWLLSEISETVWGLILGFWSTLPDLLREPAEGTRSIPVAA